MLDSGTTITSNPCAAGCGCAGCRRRGSQGGAASGGCCADEAAPLPGLTEWVRIYGYAQIDYLITQLSQSQLDPSSGQPLNQNRIFVRRARLGADIERPYIAGRIEFRRQHSASTASTARIIDAEALDPGCRDRRYAAGSALVMMGTTGLMKRSPSASEIGQADTERLFMERSDHGDGLLPGEYLTCAFTRPRWLAISALCGGGHERRTHRREELPGHRPQHRERRRRTRGRGDLG